MSKSMDEYRAAWANYPTGTPLPDPRGPHHMGMRRNSDFELLCQAAEGNGEHVGLVASTYVFEKDTSNQRRELVELRVGKRHRRLTEHDLGAASRELLRA